VSRNVTILENNATCIVVGLCVPEKYLLALLLDGLARDDIWIDSLAMCKKDTGT